MMAEVVVVAENFKIYSLLGMAAGDKRNLNSNSKTNPPQFKSGIINNSDFLVSVFLSWFLWGNSIVLVNTNIWCNILVAAKVFPVVKNQHLLLCTLLIGNSLAMEVCATGCNYFITFFIALCVENRVCFFLIVYEFEFCCDLTQWLLLQKLSFKCYVVQGLAYLIRVYAQTSISFWIRLMMDSEHNQVNRFPQTPGEAKKSNNEVQQKGDNNPSSVANKLSGKRLVKPKRTI
uniref:Uncharacterized protein n=1 Tax=Helianthus annuus TaxID=4232 RepID=A0A251TBJ8_HELAN